MSEVARHHNNARIAGFAAHDDLAIGLEGDAGRKHGIAVAEGTGENSVRPKLESNCPAWASAAIGAAATSRQTMARQKAAREKLTMDLDA